MAKSIYESYVNLFGDSDTSHSAVDELPIQFLIPRRFLVADDNTLSVTTVHNAADVVGASSYNVLELSNDDLELVRCLVQFNRLFGKAFNVLTGFPNAEYSVEFESETYSLRKVSYEAIIGELIEAKRVEALLADERSTPYEKERQSFTRKNGTVKELRDFNEVDALLKSSKDVTADQVDPDGVASADDTGVN